MKKLSIVGMVVGAAFLTSAPGGMIGAAAGERQVGEWCRRGKMAGG